MTDPKVWLVTGSSRGLGRAVVEEALAAGHKVAATARDPRTLDDLAGRYGPRILPLELDVTDPDRARAVVGETIAALGGLDVVVNNAGYADLAPVEQISLDDFRAQIDAAFYGTVYVTKAALPTFVRQGHGHFIQVTSIGGRINTPGVGAYQAAKWAVGGFSGSLAKEVAGLGVKVTLAEPGAMRTDWAGSSMRVPPIEPRYDDTVGAIGRHLRAVTGSEPIDPVKVARAFLEIAESAEPPLHLLLGDDAVDLMAAEARDRADEAAKWESLSRSVYF